MKTSRRDFLKKSAAAVASTTVLSSSLLAFSKPSGVLGLQLYSVREDMRNDPLGTLKKVADIGYKELEHASYRDRKFYGYSAAEMKKVLGDLGMHMLSGHTSLRMDHWDAAKNDVSDSWKYTVEDAMVLGQKTLINPWMDESLRTDLEKVKQFTDLSNKVGEYAKNAGVTFGYHNHWFEFDTEVGGQLLYDVLMSSMDPRFVIQQLDIGNCLGGGGHAMEILKKYPGRFQSMHVKDEIKNEASEEGYESTVLGKGIIGVKEVLAFAKSKGGTTDFIIEQESYQDKTPIESIKMDFEQMKSWGF